jgi:hypothetical protein
MTHFATPDFWSLYQRLPQETRALADKCFALLKANPNHPSLRFKKAGRYWVARVGLHYRALALERPEGLVWLWIGHHNEYDQLIKS